MSVSSTTPELAQLVAEPSLMALARAVAGADGPDVLQEAVLASLRCQPDKPIPWLRRVIRNGGRMHARATARRHARELAIQGPSSAQGAESVEQLAMRSQLLDALHEELSALDHPFREALRLRFEEELSVREVGVRLGCSTNTAGWRIREGLARLRARLDARFGERRHWYGALIAVTGMPSPHLVTEPGVAMRTTAGTMGYAAIMVGLVGVTALAWRSQEANATTVAEWDDGVQARFEAGDDAEAPLRPASRDSTTDADVRTSTEKTTAANTGEDDVMNSMNEDLQVGIGIKSNGTGMSACGDEIAALAQNAKDIYLECRESAGFDAESPFRFHAKFELVDGRSRLVQTWPETDSPAADQLTACMSEHLFGEDEMTPGFEGVLTFVLHTYAENLDAEAILAGVPTERAQFDVTGLPVRGSGGSSSPLTLVECVDFECPFTRAAAPIIDQVLDEYAGKVEYLVLLNPLAFHEGAELKARAAVAAHRQGKFWEFADAFYLHPAPMSQQELVALAQKFELDAERFVADLADEATAAEVVRQQELCMTHGGKGTPTFFVNGRRLAGARDIDVFRLLLERELADA